MHFSWVIQNIINILPCLLGPRSLSLSHWVSETPDCFTSYHSTFYAQHYFWCGMIWNRKSVCVLCDFLKPLKPNISRIGKYISVAPLMLFISTNQSDAFLKCHHFYFQLRRGIPPTAMAISSAIQSFHLCGAWKRGTTCCISLKQLFISNDLHLENSLQC